MTREGTKAKEDNRAVEQLTAVEHGTPHLLNCSPVHLLNCSVGQRPTVAVGMSGGVDSSVAAFLLKKQGYNVIGVTMKIWDEKFTAEHAKPLAESRLSEDETAEKKIELISACPPGASAVSAVRSGCYGPGEADDIEAAQKVARQIGIPHYVLDLHVEYEQAVLKYFRDEYLAGKTPNPCVICNQKIKFGLLLDKAQQSGLSFDFFATGHYARTLTDADFEKHGLTRTESPTVSASQCSSRCESVFSKGRARWFLLKAADSKKDQTYFLYRLTQEQLGKVIFPLGNLLKDEVKKMASEIGLKDVADKAESQDFYEGDCYADFFEQGDSQPGDIIDTSGRIVGRHRGVIHYTIGQRKGLNIGGLKEPLYVIALDSQNNRVLVGPREKLLAKGLIAEELNWISIAPPAAPLKATAKIRSTHPEKPCTLIPLDEHSACLGEGETGPTETTEAPGRSRVRVDFDEPQMSITPGQSIVFYSGDLVLGGGVIEAKT
ncbi:MAG: tRNA 2-thiouridine(34) synthase MnmA [Sedimentisphaerales bacterium]